MKMNKPFFLPFLMKSILFSILFILTYFVNAQNLVPNPSFEEYYTCPGSVGGLGVVLGDPYIKNWYSMSITPDYMHYCAGEEASNYPTNNAWGYQEPYDGDGYVSILTKDNFVDEREYIGVELIESLVVGELYDVSFFVSDADGGELEYIDCVTNNIGLRFLTNPPYYWNHEVDNNPLLPNNDSDINYSELLTDSIGWTLVKSTFVADENYTHIVIGNFYDDDNTIFETSDENEGCLAMYYIDMVCVDLPGGDCIVGRNIECNDVSIFPNPILNKLRINKSLENVKIFNVLGELCFSQIGLSSEFDLALLSTGLYILKAKCENGLFFKLIPLYFTRMN